MCGRLSPLGGHTWNSIYASLALGLRVLTDRLLVFPCTGGGCSTMPGGIRFYNLGIYATKSRKEYIFITTRLYLPITVPIY